MLTLPFVDSSLLFLESPAFSTRYMRCSPLKSGDNLDHVIEVSALGKEPTLSVRLTASCLPTSHSQSTCHASQVGMSLKDRAAGCFRCPRGNIKLITCYPQTRARLSAFTLITPCTLQSLVTSLGLRAHTTRCNATISNTNDGPSAGSTVNNRTKS